MAAPIKLSVIDDSNRGDHAYLDADDVCYYLYEYTSGRDWRFSAANGLISNLKKQVRLRGTSQYVHKGHAIRQIAAEFGSALNREWLRDGTIVPIPPSKAKTDPDYDDRMLQVCRAIAGSAFDVRELIVSESRPAFHLDLVNRMTVGQLASHMAIDESCCSPYPDKILVVDDVLVSGTHFKAVKRRLLARFPEASVYGLFVARRVFAQPDEEEASLF